MIFETNQTLFNKNTDFLSNKREKEFSNSDTPTKISAPSSNPNKKNSETITSLYSVNQMNRTKFVCVVGNCCRSYLYICTLKKHLQSVHKYEYDEIIEKYGQGTNFITIYKKILRNPEIFNFVDVKLVSSFNLKENGKILKKNKTKTKQNNLTNKFSMEKVVTPFREEINKFIHLLMMKFQDYFQNLYSNINKNVNPNENNYNILNMQFLVNSLLQQPQFNYLNNHMNTINIQNQLNTILQTQNLLNNYLPGKVML